MTDLKTTNLTELEKGQVRNAARQAEEAVALILRIVYRRSVTPGDLAFPILSLKNALQAAARHAHLDL